MSEFATFNILSWTCNLAYVCLNLLICKMRMTLALKWSNSSFQNFMHMQIQISSCSSIPPLLSPSLVFYSFLLYFFTLFFTSLLSFFSSPLYLLHSISYDVASYNCKFINFELKYTIFWYKFVLLFFLFFLGYSPIYLSLIIFF